VGDLDGRLDLDDLGHVIEQAPDLGSPRVDHATDLDVLEGATGPSFGDRLESWGITPWLRRHRVLIGSVTATVVVASALAWTVQSRRLPDDDGRLHLAVVDFSTSNGQGFDASDPNGQVFSAGYTLVPQREGDTDSIVGITGPGIRASSASGQSANAISNRPLWMVSAVLGCDDPRALTAVRDDYRLVARRVDRYGRAVQQSIPLPIGTTMPWDQQVRSMCLQSQVLTRLGVVWSTAALSRDFQGMVVRMRVRSLLDQDLLGTVAGGAGQPVRADATQRVLQANGTTDLEIRYTFEDCDNPMMDSVPVPSPGSAESVYESERGANINISPTLDNQVYAFWPAVWSPSTTAQVRRLVRAACAGLPTTSARTVSGRSASDADVQDWRSLRGDASATVVRLRLDIATTSPSVRVSDVLSQQDIDQANEPSIIGGTARTVGGHAVVDVLWRTSCDPQGVTQPILQLHTSRGSRQYAQFVTLNDTRLVDSLLSACPGLTTDQLASGAWGSLPVPTG
jgi:hypothetical protein